MFTLRHLLPAFCALALVAAAAPASASPTGKILVVTTNGQLESVLATLMPSCPAALCFDAVSGTTFSTMDFSSYNELAIGWDEGSASDTNPALHSRAADIDAFVLGGGGLIILSQYASGDYTWMPGGAGITVVAEHANDVILTPVGSAHPIYAGLTDATLSNWNSARHNYFTGGVPASLQLLTTKNNGAPVSYAGPYGAGCVYITGQDPDWHSAFQGNAAAKQIIDQSTQWALGPCSTITPPTPELPTFALLGVGTIFAGLVVMRRFA